MDRVSIENELVQVANQMENGVGALVGAVSSLCTEYQLSALLGSLKEQIQNDI